MYKMRGVVREHSAGRTGKRVAALLALATAAALALLGPGAGSASAAQRVCPGTFRVLHDDHIGRLTLASGNYQITTLTSRPTCRRASALFTRFLEDFDGELPSNWRVLVNKSSFVKPNGNGFSVQMVSGPPKPGGGSGRHPATGKFCPGTFTVEHNDRIGTLRFPKGPYLITLLQRQGLTCARASTLFSQFLGDPNGVLPSPWILNVQRGKFRRGSGGKGFRVKPAT
jgi:hypothetical protein